jgi:hypothetical protein
MNELVSKLESIEEASNLEVDKLGLEYLESTIKPFCEKYNLWFTNGMGSISFHNPEYDLYLRAAEELLQHNVDEIVEFDDEDRYPIEKYILKYPGVANEMEDIFEVLDTVIFEFEFGFSVPSYKPSPNPCYNSLSSPPPTNANLLRSDLLRS